MRDETPSNELKAAAKHIARLPVDRAGRFPVSIVVSGTVFSAVLLLIVAQERHAASSPRPTTSKHDHWGARVRLQTLAQMHLAKTMMCDSPRNGSCLQAFVTFCGNATCPGAGRHSRRHGHRTPHGLAWSCISTAASTTPGSPGDGRASQSFAHFDQP